MGCHRFAYCLASTRVTNIHLISCSALLLSVAWLCCRLPGTVGYIPVPHSLVVTDTPAHIWIYCMHVLSPLLQGGQSYQQPVCITFKGKPALSILFLYTGCERYWRPFFETNINLHKIFKNNNSLIKLLGIVYLYVTLHLADKIAFSSKDLLYPG